MNRRMMALLVLLALAIPGATLALEPGVVSDPPAAFDPSEVVPETHPDPVKDPVQPAAPVEPETGCESLRRAKSDDECNLDPYDLPVPEFDPVVKPKPKPVAQPETPTSVPAYSPPRPHSPLPYTGWQTSSAAMLATIFLLTGIIAYMTAARLGLTAGLYEDVRACRDLAGRLARYNRRH